MKIIEIITHYKSLDNLESIFENRKKYHPDTYYIIVDNSNTFEPPKDFNGIVLDGMQNHIDGLSTSDYHYLGTSQGLNYLRYVIRDDLSQDYNYVLVSQQDMFFYKSISELPEHSFIQTIHYDKTWDKPCTDIWFGIDMNMFSKLDLDVHNSFLAMTDTRIEIGGDNWDGDIIHINCELITHTKNDYQEFKFQGELICTNMLELLHRGVVKEING